MKCISKLMFLKYSICFGINYWELKIHLALLNGIQLFEKQRRGHCFKERFGFIHAHGANLSVTITSKQNIYKREQFFYIIWYAWLGGNSVLFYFHTQYKLVYIDNGKEKKIHIEMLET